MSSHQYRRTVQSQIQHQPSSRFSKLGSSRIGARRLGKVGRVGPATDGKQDLQLAVALLEQEQLLDASIDIGPDVVP